MFNKIYDKIKQFIKNNYKFLIIWLLVILLFTIRLPYVIYTPGGAIDIEKRIDTDIDKNIDGKIKMAYVSMLRGTIPNILLSYVMPNWDLEKSSSLTYKNQSLDELLKIEKIQMQASVNHATILAYNKANKKIKINKITNTVTHIYDGVKTELKVFDELEKINNVAVSDSESITKEIAKYNEDDVVTLTVIRNKKEINVKSTLKNMEGYTKIGISLIQTFEYDLDPEIEVSIKSSESGPSGGFMLTLGIYNMISDKDITHGYTIVGTGTIDELGNVGRIDGVKYKILGAKKNKADYFFCPNDNLEEALKYKKEFDLDLEVVGFSNFEEAIEYLNTIK